jgi:hypothetical protein
MQKRESLVFSDISFLMMLCSILFDSFGIEPFTKEGTAGAYASVWKSTVRSSELHLL